MLLVTPIAASALAQGSRPAASAVKSGSGSGTITAVDAKGGTVTIKHGPIPTIGWPAMTMTFRASPRPCSRDCGRGSGSHSPPRRRV
ncbi:copper-binding protein (plasmid) [Sphingomonas panni]|uniref:copper-binding protein n=1 Tax=Sphingomonas TaxID=13687 RepID=UPI003704902A